MSEGSAQSGSMAVEVAGLGRKRHLRALPVQYDRLIYDVSSELFVNLFSARVPTATAIRTNFNFSEQYRADRWHWAANYERGRFWAAPGQAAASTESKAQWCGENLIRG